MNGVQSSLQMKVPRDVEENHREFPAHVDFSLPACNSPSFFLKWTSFFTVCLRLVAVSYQY
jgi:hypothetical protein